MRKILFILIFIGLSFFLELLLCDFGGSRFVPNFTLLSVMFVGLYFGIRHSIFASIIAGLIKDSFSVGVFGSHVFIFILSAYATTILKKYIYSSGSRFSRIFLVFVVTCLYVMIQFVINFRTGAWDIFEILRYILFPEIITTLIVTTFVFESFKKCVSRLFG